MNQDSHSNSKHATDELTGRDSNELSWLAFRYIANEMSANECREFEVRLQNDQLARESVADALEATKLINLAHDRIANQTVTLDETISRKPFQRRSQNSRSAKPIILATLACSLAAIVVFYGLGQGNKQGSLAANSSVEPTQIDETQIDLAEAWADSDWEETLVVHNSINEIESDFDLDDVSTEFDSDWIEDTIGELKSNSFSVEN